MSENYDIFLFKSTYRNEYKRLLLSALSAPKGSIFRTYYKNEHVSPDLLKEANSSPNSFIGKKVILIFFNLKDDTPLKFYPLRNFTVQEIAPPQTRGALEFFLTPNEFYQYTDAEIKIFNDNISAQMGILPPKDHSYAQFFHLQCLDELKTSLNQEAWENLVEHLDQEQIGQDDDFRKCFFLHINPLKENGAEVSYVAGNGYGLRPGKRYVLEGFFYKPRETKESFQVKLEGSEDIEPISNQIITILPARNRPFGFEFSCKPVKIDKNTEIRIIVPEKEEGSAPRLEFQATIHKQSIFRQIGWEEIFVLFGFIMTSLGQTLFSSLAIKMPLSIIGNFLAAFGIALLAKKY